MVIVIIRLYVAYYVAVFEDVELFGQLHWYVAAAKVAKTWCLYVFCGLRWHRFSPKLRSMCHCLYQVVSQRFQQSSAEAVWTVVGTVIFLRFINPAIGTINSNKSRCQLLHQPAIVVVCMPCHGSSWSLVQSVDSCIMHSSTISSQLLGLRL